MTTKQKQLIENYIRIKVKKALNEKISLKENWREQEVVKFERWAAARAKSLNLDLDAYINEFKTAFEVKY